MSDSKNIVKLDQLERLKPYVLRLIEQYGSSGIQNLKDRLKVIAVGNNQAAFTIEGKEAGSANLRHIQQLCYQHLSLKLASPELETGGNGQNYQIMHFEVRNDRMNVRYFSYGSSNNFETALTLINQIFKTAES